MSCRDPQSLSLTDSEMLMAFVGFNQNRFFPITAWQAQQGSRSIEELRALSPGRPPMVYIDLPEDPDEARTLLTASTTSVLRQTERFQVQDRAMALFPLVAGPQNHRPAKLKRAGRSGHRLDLAVRQSIQRPPGTSASDCPPA